MELDEHNNPIGKKVGVCAMEHYEISMCLFDDAVKYINTAREHHAEGRDSDSFLNTTWAMQSLLEIVNSFGIGNLIQRSPEVGAHLKQRADYFAAQKENAGATFDE